MSYIPSIRYQYSLHVYDASEVVKALDPELDRYTETHLPKKRAVEWFLLWILHQNEHLVLRGYHPDQIPSLLHNEFCKLEVVGGDLAKQISLGVKREEPIERLWVSRHTLYILQGVHHGFL